MCIRKVLYCPICKGYQRIPETTVPAPSGEIVFIQKESPCGLSYCHHYNPYFSFIDPPINLHDLENSCNPRCVTNSCRLVPIIRECCGPSASLVHFRRLSLRLALAGPVETPPPLQRPERPPTRRAPVSSATSEPVPVSLPPPAYTKEQVYAWICRRCTWADCRRLRQGEKVIFTVAESQITLRYGGQGFVDTRVSHRNYLEPGAQEFKLSLGWLINGIYWSPEDQETYKGFISDVFSV